MNKSRPHSELGTIVPASQVRTGRQSLQRSRQIVLLLVASVALTMSGFGIIMPVFARRLGEFGDGVEALGLMTMAFALSQLLFSPLMGSLADRRGRRPIVLLSLAAFTAVNVGYLFAPNAIAFIAIRGVAGALTAGLFPAAMGVVADVIPEEQRARWTGIVMGGYGAGFVFGPVGGGLLYDGWGFAAPFATSAVLALLAFVAAALLIPETRPPVVRRREVLRERRAAARGHVSDPSFRTSLPKPLSIFATLLFLDFIGSFTFAFVEPQMVFYVYDVLDWSTVQFGLLVGVYGLAMVFGQTALGSLSDHLGRRPVILVGLLLSATLYAGLTVLHAFNLMILGSVVAGLGAALVGPALSSLYFDITTDQHRSRVVGIKESSLALGGVLGPLFVVIAANLTTPHGVFIIGLGLTLGAASLAAVVLHEPKHVTEQPAGVAWDVETRRCLAAQATLSGLVLSASQARQLRPAA